SGPRGALTVLGVALLSLAAKLLVELLAPLEQLVELTLALLRAARSSGVIFRGFAIAVLLEEILDPRPGRGYFRRRVRGELRLEVRLEHLRELVGLAVVRLGIAPGRAGIEQLHVYAR